MFYFVFVQFFSLFRLFLRIRLIGLIRTLRGINATFLPMRELHKILNKKTFSVMKKVFTPSINNYCSRCGEELYDDGKAEECFKCKAPTVKHFTETIKYIPSYMFKHSFNKLYAEFKNILIPKE